METILSITLFATFLILGFIHLNWMFGGTWGYDNAIPTDVNGQRILNPGKISCGLVGFGLLMFGAFYLVRSGIIISNIPGWAMTFGNWFIPIIFILRAIGEFKYVGLFKKVKNSKFGKWDTRLYSPLCLTIGIIGLILTL